MESVIEALAYIVVALSAGWIGRLEWKAKENSDETRALGKEVEQLKLDLARNYHSKSELKEIVQEAMKPVQETLARLSRAVEEFGRGRLSRHNDDEER